MYCLSTSVRLGKSLFVFHCHESLDVLAKYLSLPGESRLFLLPDVSQCTVRVPSICLGELHLSSAGFGLSSVDPAPEQVSSSRRATSFVAKCFQCTVEVPLIRLGKSLFVFYCHESPDVLAKYLQSAWGVTSLSAARCLLMYCQSTNNLPGGVTPAFCWFWTELS